MTSSGRRDALTRAQVQGVYPDAAPFETEQHHGKEHENIGRRLIASRGLDASQHQRRRDQHESGVQFDDRGPVDHAGVGQRHGQHAGEHARDPARQPRDGHLHAVFHEGAAQHGLPVERHHDGQETEQVSVSERRERSPYKTCPRNRERQGPRMGDIMIVRILSFWRKKNNFFFLINTVLV